MNNKSLITEPLGLFGWNNFEPIILASLSRDMPMLLIGNHGCAKSFILERLAESLNYNYRFYNASLINYDDLVGIPVPTSDNKSLDYISNPNSIWDAEVVFFDEINRTKPELQNKLFPIIYDKRIQGISLNKLKHRWAAMNPPCKEDGEEDELSYLGASPLDPALADRFPILIEVPSWDDLSNEDKNNILKDQFEGRHEFPIDIHKLIEDVKSEYQHLIKNKQEVVSKYILTLMEVSKNVLGYISPRRATMMQESFLAIHASRIVIARYQNNQEEITFKDTAYLHILSCLPNIAHKRIDKGVLFSLCEAALRISLLDESLEKNLLLVGNPLEKLKLAIKNKDQIKEDILNEVIPSTISKLGIYQRRVMALISYLTFRSNKNINASIIETLSMEIESILQVNNIKSYERLVKRKIADKIVTTLESVDKSKPYYKYLNNYLYSFFPNDYADENDVTTATNTFISLWEELKSE